MSVESEILRIQRNIADTYATVAAKGGEVPRQPTSANLAAAVASIPAVSNPNLLDNWYFADPINQRGQTEYLNTFYGIDRWKSDGSVYADMTLHPNSHISVTGKSNAIISFCQPVSDHFNLFGKTITFSILTADNKLFSTTETLPVSEDTVLDGNDVNISPGCSIDIFYSADGKQLLPRIIFYNTATTVSLAAAKLELGSQQTLARQDASSNWVLNDPPPNKALELLKCQRYFQVFSDESLRPKEAVDFRPAMRVTPALGTIEIDGTTYYTADANP